MDRHPGEPLGRGLPVPYSQLDVHVQHGQRLVAADIVRVGLEEPGQALRGVHDRTSFSALDSR
jgi:hypothetical protein